MDENPELRAYDSTRICPDSTAEIPDSLESRRPYGKKQYIIVLAEISPRTSHGIGCGQAHQMRVIFSTNLSTSRIP